MHRVKNLFPGIALCLAIMLVGELTADLLGGYIIKLQGIENGSSPVSGIFMAVILGLLVRNTFGMSDYFRDGVSFSMQHMLKAGIVLLGIRLSFYDVIKLGTWESR